MGTQPLETRPPFKPGGKPSRTNAETRKHTYVVVVLAADGLRRASGVGTDTDDGNRAAVEAELAGHTLGVDAERTEHGKARSGIGLRGKRRQHSARRSNWMREY